MNLKHVARALARGSCPCYQPGKVEAVSRRGNVGQSRAQRRCEAQSLSLATAHLGTPTRSCEHPRASLPEGAGGRRRAKARPGRAGVTAQMHGLGYSRLSSFPPTTDSWANAANIRPAGSDRRWPWELPFVFLTQYELNYSATSPRPNEVRACVHGRGLGRHEGFRLRRHTRPRPLSGPWRVRRGRGQSHHLVF